MDWFHWSMRIDDLAFASIAGNPRELEVLSRRLDVFDKELL